MEPTDEIVVQTPAGAFYASAKPIEFQRDENGEPVIRYVGKDCVISSGELSLR